MSYKFERPVGAAADARELEYVAALHQTDDAQEDSWMDGSIEAIDVKNFLLSRYGIKVTEQEVIDNIFAEMGGGDNCIDLTEGKLAEGQYVVMCYVMCNVCYGTILCLCALHNKAGFVLKIPYFLHREYDTE